MPVGSRVFLRERIPPRHWFGGGLICACVALIGLAGELTMHGTITNPDAAKIRGHAGEGIYLDGSPEKGVLLIHGLTGAPAEMLFIARELNRLGFTVHAPRLGGHCQGVAALKRTTYEDWIDGLETPLARLRSAVKQAYTAGICVGGVLGLMLAQREACCVARSAIYSPL
jgi:alpha-beta hydrolase superfamily lysophospholipase